MANLITLSRFPLLLIYVLMLYLGNATVRLLAVAMFLIVFMLDTVDGIVARRRGETSLFGSVLDIASDRVLEFVSWIVFADLGLISVAVPLIVITRGVLVDAVRSVGASQGQSPFKQMRSGLGKFLVAAPVMRTSYSVSKAFAFGLLTLGLGLRSLADPGRAAELVVLAGQIITWIAVALCLLRGAPVLVEARKLLADPPVETAAQAGANPPA